jgi:hypothetical protein
MIIITGTFPIMALSTQLVWEGICIQMGQNQSKIGKHQKEYLGCTLLMAIKAL